MRTNCRTHSMNHNRFRSNLIRCFSLSSLFRFVTGNKHETAGARFYKGIKGPKLILNSFSYFRNNSNPERTYWLCSRNRYQKCKARLITLHATREVIIKNQNHNHGPERTNEEEELTFETVLNYLNAMNDNLKVDTKNEHKTYWIKYISWATWIRIKSSRSNCEVFLQCGIVFFFFL